MSSDIVEVKKTASTDKVEELEFGNGALQALNDGVSGLNATILLQVLNSENGNMLKSRLLQLLTDELNSKISKKAKLSKIIISEVLSSEEQLWLSNSYSDLNLVFNNSSVRSHPYSSASRTCERAILFNKLCYDPFVITDEIRIKEVGGDAITSILKGERGIHYCSPILNNYDGNRYSGRLYSALNTIGNKIFKDECSLKVLKEYCEQAGDLSAENSVFCFKKSQCCNIKADALMFLHSTYDMSLTEVGDCMDSAEAIVAYGSFIFSSIILTDDKGLIPKINSDYYITRDKLGRRKRICFGFKNCNGFNYHHNYYNYESFVTTSQFLSSNGKAYTLELLENRDGIQFFKVTKLVYTLKSSLPHRIYMDHLKDKYIIRFPKCQYTKEQTKNKKYYSIMTKNGNIVNVKEGDYLSWTTLPKNTIWRTFIIDAKIVDRTMAYVAGASDEKFKPDQVIQYLRSVATREMMYTSVLPKNELPPVEDLCAVAHAIYLTLYHHKYMFGKVLQQGILETNALRTGVKARNVLKEFEQKNSWYMCFLELVRLKKKNNFDPTFFITPPLEYLEFNNTLGESTLVADVSFSRVFDLTKMIVSSKLLADQNDIFAYDDNIPKFVKSEHKKDKLPKRLWRKLLNILGINYIKDKSKKFIQLLKSSKKYFSKILHLLLKPFSYTKKILTKICMGIVFGGAILICGIGLTAGIIIKGGKVVLQTSTNLFRGLCKKIRNLVKRYKQYQKDLKERHYQQELSILRSIVDERDEMYDRLMRLRNANRSDQKTIVKGVKKNGDIKLVGKSQEEKILEKHLDETNDLIVCWTNLIIEDKKRIPDFIETVSISQCSDEVIPKQRKSCLSKFMSVFKKKNKKPDRNMNEFFDVPLNYDSNPSGIELPMSTNYCADIEMQSFNIPVPPPQKEQSVSNDSSVKTDESVPVAPPRKKRSISSDLSINSGNSGSVFSSSNTESNFGGKHQNSFNDSFSESSSNNGFIVSETNTVIVPTKPPRSKPKNDKHCSSSDTLANVSDLPLDRLQFPNKQQNSCQAGFNERVKRNRSLSEVDLDAEYQIEKILENKGYPFYEHEPMLPQLVTKVIIGSKNRLQLSDVLADLETLDCEEVIEEFDDSVKDQIVFLNKLEFIDPLKEYDIEQLKPIFEFTKNLNTDEFIDNKNRQVLKFYSLLGFIGIHGNILELGCSPGTWTIEILNKFYFDRYDAVSPVGSGYLDISMKLKDLVGTPKFFFHNSTAEQYLTDCTEKYDVIICDVATSDSWINNEGQLALLNSVNEVLKPGGSVVVKISNIFLSGLKESLNAIADFEYLTVLKPDGSRRRSTEAYLICNNFLSNVRKPLLGLELAKMQIAEFYNELLVGKTVKQLDATALLETKQKLLSPLMEHFSEFQMVSWELENTKIIEPLPFSTANEVLVDPYLSPEIVKPVILEDITENITGGKVEIKKNIPVEGKENEKLKGNLNIKPAVFSVNAVKEEEIKETPTIEEKENEQKEVVVKPAVPKRTKRRKISNEVKLSEKVYNETTLPKSECNDSGNIISKIKNLISNMNLNKDINENRNIEFIGKVEPLAVVKNREPIVVTDVYPRKAIYNNVERLLDVDGSKFECLFRALCEDRNVNMENLRAKLHSVGNGYRDLIEELQPGNMAGTAVIEAFVKLYSVHVFVDYQIKGNTETISFCNNNPRTISFRNIALVLKNKHYYIKSTCHEDYPIEVQRFDMYHDFNLLEFTSKLLNLVNFKELRNFGELKSINNDGIYFINNLSKVCLIHSECRNNHLLKLMKTLEEKRKFNVSLIALFEKDNFDIDYLELLLKKTPCVGFRFIDLDLGGYFCAILYHTLVTDLPLSIKRNFNEFLNHNCSKGKMKSLSLQGDNGIYYTCFNSNQKGCHSDPNILIELRKGTKKNGSNILMSLPTQFIIEGFGDNGCCENITDIASALASYLNNRQKVLFIQFKTDFTNNKTLIELIAQKSNYFNVSVNAIVSVDSTSTIPYFCDSSDEGKKKNAMIEQFQVWENDTNVVNTTLKDAYNILVSVLSKENDSKLHFNVDNSTALFDVSKGKFIYGQRIEAPYFYGYTLQGLVPTKDLFDNNGGIVLAKLKDYRQRGIPYICFNKNSKLLHAVEFVQKYTIDAAKDFKICSFKDVRGGPGCGKSTFILKMVENRPNSMIVTMTKEGSNDLKKRIKDTNVKFDMDRVRTGDSLLLNGTNLSVDVLFVDEARLVHCGQWLWLAYVTGCKEVYIVGDPSQIAYSNRNGYSVYRATPQDWKFDNIIHLKYNRRNPLDVVASHNVNHMHDFKILGTSNIVRSMDVVAISGKGDINVPADSVKVLVFTQSEKSELKQKYPNVNTVHEFQGNQCDEVALVRLVNKDSDTVYSSKSHILVALSRHRIKLTYYTARLGDEVSKMIVASKQRTTSEIMSYQSEGVDDKELVSLYANEDKLKGGSDEILIKENVKPDYAISLYLKDKKIRAIVHKNQESGYVSWSFKKDIIFPEYPDLILPIINDYSIYDLQEFLDSILPGSSVEFREFDHERFEYEAPLHVDGISVGLSMPSFKKYDRLLSKLRTSIQYPIHNSQKLNVKAFIERNGMVPQLQGMIDDKSRA
ncbi:replicase [Culex tritaeniorhynchus Negev-like virus]|nr:replicase [Culex tritaeniorhynchus Negev-like virus]